MFGYRKDGEKCRFKEPFMLGVDQAYWNSKLPPLWKKIKEASDDRAFVILLALVIEHLVDETLETWMPRYKALSEHQDFNFSIKLELLNALSLVPGFIIRGSHCIRQLRNDFAHDLNIEKLEQLAKKVEMLRNLSDEVVVQKDLVKGSSARDLAKFLSFVVCVGLLGYRENMKYLRKAIEKDDYLNGLKSRLNEEIMTK